ncbi:MAG: hypothetical protein R2715_19720 [Ilumatobacteraceae bacterium]
MFTDPGDGAPATSFLVPVSPRLPTPHSIASSPAAEVDHRHRDRSGQLRRRGVRAYPELLLFEDEYGPVFATSAEGGLSN